MQIDLVACRNRNSPYPMISVDQAHEIIKNVCIQTSEIERIHIKDALSRVLAEDVQSNDPLPSFPCSIKDGYAVKSADGAGPRQVVDNLVAGDTVRIPVFLYNLCYIFFKYF